MRCREGFDPKPPSVTCSFATWVPPPRCVPQSCHEVQEIVAAEPGIAQRCAPIQDGQSCELFCRPGTYKSGDLFCRAGQLVFARCIPLGCVRPEKEVAGLQHAGLGTCAGGRPNGKKCWVPCSTDPRFASTADLVCEMGEWRLLRSCGEPASTMPGCGPPPPIRWAFRPRCPHLGAGASCDVECVGGRQLDPSRPSRLLCLAGVWLQPACIEAGCERPPRIPFSDEQEMEACAWAPPRGICKVKCTKGYVLSVSSAPWLVCLEGLWRVFRGGDSEGFEDEENCVPELFAKDAAGPPHQT